MSIISRKCIYLLSCKTRILKRGGCSTTYMLWKRRCISANSSSIVARIETHGMIYLVMRIPKGKVGVDLIPVDRGNHQKVGK